MAKGGKFAKVQEIEKIHASPFFAAAGSLRDLPDISIFRHWRRRYDINLNCGRARGNPCVVKSLKWKKFITHFACGTGPQKTEIYIPFSLLGCVENRNGNFIRR